MLNIFDGNEYSEIAPDGDGSITLATLKRHFGAQAVGLIYFGVDRGMIMVPFNESPVTDHSKLLPPGGVWDEDFYIFRTPITTGDIDAAKIEQKRMEDVVSAGQEDAQTRSERVKEVQKFIYFDLFQSGTRKNCVVAFAKKLAVTFKHGTHQNMRVGQTLSIFKEDGVPIPVICGYISKRHDFIIYYRKDGSFAEPKIEEKPTVGMSYLLLGFPFESEIPQCLQGTVSSIEYFLCARDFPKGVLGQGDAVRRYSGEAAFSLETGALFAMNVEHRSSDTFVNDPINASSADILDAAKETTHHLLPMTAITCPTIGPELYEAVQEWKGERLRGKIATLKIKEEEAGDLTKKLIEKGICNENIGEEIEKILGQKVNRDKWFDHKDKILEGLYSLMAEFKVDVPRKEADEHEPQGPGTSEMPPSHSTQPDVVHSSMDCYFTGLENMEPEQENVEEVTAE